jgi:hypothetical protein
MIDKLEPLSDSQDIPRPLSKSKSSIELNAETTEVSSVPKRASAINLSKEEKKDPKGLYKALEEWIPSKANELYLIRGDVINITTVFSDDRCYGSNVETGESGFTSLSLLEKICDNNTPLNDDTGGKKEKSSFGTFIAHQRVSTTRANEIQILPGDKITLLARLENGWCRGLNVRSGEEGIFPIYCLKDYDVIESQLPRFNEPESPTHRKVSLSPKNQNQSQSSDLETSQNLETDIYFAQMDQRATHPHDLNLSKGDRVLIKIRLSDGSLYW